MSKLSRRSYDYSFSGARKKIFQRFSRDMAGGFSTFPSVIKFPVLAGYTGIQNKTPQPRAPHGWSHPMLYTCWDWEETPRGPPGWDEQQVALPTFYLEGGQCMRRRHRGERQLDLETVGVNLDASLLGFYRVLTAVLI